ncbi:MAG: EAL domain-containing protein [Gammaproteobacteria bacterium]|nr:EAL domain-containing protein [Gammaproteobacteria bacterium]
MVDIAPSFPAAKSELTLLMAVSAELSDASRELLSGLFPEATLLEAENGFAALQQFCVASPTLVLMTTQLPLQDGFVSCQRMRQQVTTAHQEMLHRHSLHLPRLAPLIVLLHPAPDAAVIAAAAAAGATDLLAFPQEQQLLGYRLKQQLAQWQTQRQQQLHYQRLEISEQVANMGHWHWNRVTDEFYLSPSLRKLLHIAANYPCERLESLIDLFERDDRDVLYDAFKQLIFSDKPISMSVALQQGREKPRYLLQSAIAVRDSSGDISDIHGTLQDISAMRELEGRIDLLANFDAHTGMANRYLFSKWLGEMVKCHRNEGQRLAVVHISIQRMTVFNEIFGRSAGDQLVKEWAQRLTHGLQRCASQRSGRIGGIRFALALSYISSPDAVVRLLQGLRTQLEAPYQLQEHQIDNMGARFGVAFFPEDGQDVESLMNCAELASRNLCHKSGDSICCYSPQMNTYTLEHYQFEKRLKLALEHEEMVLFYQPKVRASDGVIVEYEALIRWFDPQHGLIPPGQFIPVAEESGLIIALGEWVIWNACEQLAKLRLEPGDDSKVPRISINLSSYQFNQKNLIEIVQQALQLNGVNPQLLDLELTESAVMEDVERSVSVLNNLKGLGVTLSIDDFGTGYSSLSYLKRFPIDTLKVDRSFVMDISTNEQDRCIAHAIITLAKSLDLQTVAEGVENREQLAILQGMGCDLIQGYLFGKPLPAAEAFKQLR